MTDTASFTSLSLPQSLPPSHSHRYFYCFFSNKYEEKTDRNYFTYKLQGNRKQDSLFG